MAISIIFCISLIYLWGEFRDCRGKLVDLGKDCKFPIKTWRLRARCELQWGIIGFYIRMECEH